MNKQDARYALRLPLNMKEKLQKRAKGQHRSLNSEILTALDDWLKRTEPKQ